MLGSDSGRYYWINAPPAQLASSDKAGLPLILALHGGGSTPVDMARFCRLAETAGDYGFATVYPSGSGPSPDFLTWNAGSCCGHAARREVDDVGFVDRLIDQLLQEYAFDASRVYVAGMSNGGMMAYRLAAELPTRIAAIACVAGCLACEVVPLSRPVPAIHFHGTADDFVPYQGGAGSRSLRQVDFASTAQTMQAWCSAAGIKSGSSPYKKVAALTELGQELTNDLALTASKKVHASQLIDGVEHEFAVEYRIDGGGHTWPGQAPLYCFMGPAMLSLSANDKICRFFRRFRL